MADRPHRVTHFTRDGTRRLIKSGKRSIMGLSPAVVFFGYETSFAAAKTVQSHLAGGNATRFVFEVSSVDQAQAVADRLRLRDVQFYVRQADDAHLSLATNAIQQALAHVTPMPLVLTGNGRAIQAIRASLRACKSGGIDDHVKAYWAHGKTGLEREDFPEPDCRIVRDTRGTLPVLGSKLT